MLGEGDAQEGMLLRGRGCLDRDAQAEPGAPGPAPLVAPGPLLACGPAPGPGDHCGGGGWWWDGGLEEGVREEVSENKIQFHYINQI